MRRGGGWMVAGAVLAAAGCASRAGLSHRVRPGENLYRIGKAYGVTYQELAHANAIGDANRIEVGQVIVIPHATRELPVGVITPDRARADRPTARELPAGSTPFTWPIPAATVSSGFGPRGESHHDGIDIPCAEGTPVRVARDGRVLYSDTLRGYGNLVIVEHDQLYATVYAHNRENRAQVGDAVHEGEVIAECGSSGKTSGANLHFEVRQANVARNPLYYLPAAPGSAGVRVSESVVENAP